MYIWSLLLSSLNKLPFLLPSPLLLFKDFPVLTPLLSHFLSDSLNLFPSIYMAKGGGLSFDPDRLGLFLDKPSIVINSFHHQEDNNLQNYHQQLYGYPHRKLKFEPVLLSSSAVAPAPVEMDSSVKNRPSPPTIQFPVNLNWTHDNQDAHIPTSDREKKLVIDEMDFFAHKKDVDLKAPPNDTDADRKDPTVSTELDFNVNTGLHLLTGNTSSDQSIVDDGISPQPDAKRAKNEISVLRAELERMNAENQLLKETLDQVTNNYSALQMHLMTMMQPPKQQQKQEDHQNTESCAKLEHGTGKQEDKKNGLMVPRQFMDLGLAAGTAETNEASLSSSEGHSGHDRSQSPGANVEGSTGGSGSGYGRDDSPEKGSPWGPNKVPRLNDTAKNVDQATEATMRKARVSVRARSEAPMITDGCQWRKYGQKMAKGNPCPRAYYRCTMAAGCPVRKQVQRCAEDRTILITTYEGNHNHPLPPAAMAMASTTSSAARMLLSGSMPSADGLMNSNFLARTLLPCSSSMATISASAPFPTVTLDLTQNPNTLQQFQRTPNQFQVPFPNSSQNLLSNPATLIPQIFGQALYNQSKFSGLQMSHDSEAAANQLGSQTATPPPSLHQGQQNPLADTVSALTADPNFTAALAAAITSLIGNSHQNSNTHNVTNTTTTTTTNSNNNNGSVATSNNNSNGNNKVLNPSFPTN